MTNQMWELVPQDCRAVSGTTNTAMGLPSLAVAIMEMLLRLNFCRLLRTDVWNRLVTPMQPPGNILVPILFLIAFVSNV